MKKILIGLFVLSTLSLASAGHKKFTNRVGVNFYNGGKEKWETLGSSSSELYERSFGINYKLLYSLNNKFRYGPELGFSWAEYSSSANDGTVGLLEYGLTGEYDFYKNDKVSVYLNASVGGAYNDLEINYLTYKFNVKAKNYYKIGLGTRFDNGFGIEAGMKKSEHKFKASPVNLDMKKRNYYLEMNYSF